MSDDLLDLIRMCVQEGETDTARNMLLGMLRANPRNIPAWELMALCTDDPKIRADCYRQILKLDPEHKFAKDGLDELTGERAHIPRPEVQQVVSLLQTVGASALDRETVARFKEMGIDISIQDDYVNISSGSKNVKVYLHSLPGSRHHLYPDEIVRQAGEPLTDLERMECPKCQATIPRWSVKCPWCSVELR